MRNNNKARMDSLILRELTNIIHNEVKNSNLGFCTVTAVNCTPDYSYCKVYVTFLNNKKKGMEALEKSKGFIRSSLARKIKIRKVPELIFTLDTSLEYGNKIEGILKELDIKPEEDTED